MPTFVPTAVAVALAVLSECDGVTISRKHEAHSDPEVFRAMASEAVETSEMASAWSGWMITPEMAWVTMLAEGGGHNLNRDHVADPWHRSTGFFAMRPACYTAFSRRAGLPFLARDGIDLDEWSAEVCGHNRAHPIQQVRVYFTAAAYYLRETCGGDVARFFTTWRYGYPGETVYSATCARIWRERFGTYPKDGRLPRNR